MADLLQSLREEHAQTSTVLERLQRQVERLEEGEKADFAVIREIVDYCLAYPAQRHHEKEDRLLAKLLARDAAAAAAAGNLPRQHEELLELTRRFTAQAGALVRGDASGEAAFLGAARSFLDSYRRHIEMEERYLFPAALWSLTLQDWRDLEAELAGAPPPA